MIKYFNMKTVFNGFNKQINDLSETLELISE